MTLRKLPSFLRAILRCLRAEQYCIMSFDKRPDGSLTVKYFLRSEFVDLAAAASVVVQAAATEAVQAMQAGQETALAQARALLDEVGNA
jgi:hypothetical protein